VKQRWRWRRSIANHLSLVNPRQAQVSYRITLTSSVVGDVVRDTYLSLTREAGDWKVAWAPTTVLPELTEGTSLFMDVVTPTRANIYDRSGLAWRRPTIVGVVHRPQPIGDEKAEETMLTVLGRLFDRSTGSIQALYESFRGTDYLIPLGEVALEDFQRIEGTLAAVGGTDWRTYSGRYYPLGEQSSQAVGYVAQITLEQVDEYRQRGYAGDEFVGQTGLEFVFENELRGQPAGHTVRDTRGRYSRPGVARPRRAAGGDDHAGRNLQLERSRRWRAARRSSSWERDTGRVLAITSSPSFNPNLFNASNPNSGPGLTEVFRAERQPVPRSRHRQRLSARFGVQDPDHGGGPRDRDLHAGQRVHLQRLLRGTPRIHRSGLDGRQGAAAARHADADAGP
jgi:hypothetical protein